MEESRKQRASDESMIKMTCDVCKGNNHLLLGRVCDKCDEGQIIKSGNKKSYFELSLYLVLLISFILMVLAMILNHYGKLR